MNESANASFPPTPAGSSMPDWYPQLLDAVRSRVTTGRSRAVSAANREVLKSYRSIGALLIERESAKGWGAKVITRLSADIRAAHPGAKGFSPRNLRYMKSFAHAWPDESVLQGSLATLPWYHHIALLEKLSVPAIRVWYAGAAVAGGWSRDYLVHQIETRFYERSGRAVTNFPTALPPDDSDLAQQITKDPYVFDFLALTQRRDEHELQSRLVAHIQRFLLELGEGFAFVGEQVRLEIAGEEFFADLLFYHVKLRRYVVIELKAKGFVPGDLGQLGMYMAAVDDLLADDDDKPTIGLLLCGSSNRIVAEYALRASALPIGVAEWISAIGSAMPEELSSHLPTIEEIEAELTDGAGA
jgi:predicted nuclease of restriction endonuclease-like (RecB) superfamily